MSNTHERPPDRRSPHWVGVLLLAAALACNSPGGSLEIRIATASNFVEPMNEIVEQFREQTGHRVSVVVGSTGRQYAQIVNGAPFDIMFAADARRPELLEADGLGLANTRFTYAVGKLALWSPTPDYVDSLGHVLRGGDFRHLAIANPELAPYGEAARESLEALDLWDQLQGRLVYGENISHAYNFVRSGNAELGFVAYSQVVKDGGSDGSWWLVPQRLHRPIRQQAILLNDTDVARAFIAFVRSDEAMSIIHAHGYDTPDAD